MGFIIHFYTIFWMFNGLYYTLSVRETFKQNWNPQTSEDLLNLLKAHRGANARLLWRGVGELLWSFWVVRNKITIEHKFPAHPADILFKCHIFLQAWAPLGKQRDEGRMNEIMEQIKACTARASLQDPPD